MTPELLGILAMSATLGGLMVAIWRDALAHTNQGLAKLRAEIRDQRADIHSLRQEARSEIQDLREESRTDLTALRKDV